MSLPIPTTTSNTTTTTATATNTNTMSSSTSSSNMYNNNNNNNNNNMNDYYYDQESERLYIELVQRSRGDLRHLLTSFFSFLHRRTDLYCVIMDNNNMNMNNTTTSTITTTNTTTTTTSRNMGFKEGEAEKIMIAAFRQFPLRRISSAPSILPQQQQPSPSSSSTSPTSSLPTTTKTTKAATATSTTTTPTTTVMGTMTNDSQPKPSSRIKTEEEDDDDDIEIQYTEEGLQIPIGNGGITSKYRWTQTLDECTVLCNILHPSITTTITPTTIRGKDIQVTFLPNTLRVQILLRNNNNNINNTEDGILLLDGELSQRIVPSESTWTIESGILQIILYKHVKTFWDCIFINDSSIKIDTSLVDSRRHIDTYDEMTQAHIRKIIFEQQQQSQGLPNSDDAIITSSDGSKPTIPSTLPKGVEYIDQEILDTKMKELGK